MPVMSMHDWSEEMGFYGDMHKAGQLIGLLPLPAVLSPCSRLALTPTRGLPEQFISIGMKIDSISTADVDV